MASASLALCEVKVVERLPPMQIRVRLIIKGGGIKMRQRLRPDLNLHAFVRRISWRARRMAGLCWKANPIASLEREAAGLRLGGDIALHA